MPQFADDGQHPGSHTPGRGRRRRRTHRRGLGRSRSGFTTKLHANTNADCWPLGLLITPGETHDDKAAVELTSGVPPHPLARMGDKGYEPDDIRTHPAKAAGCC